MADITSQAEAEDAREANAPPGAVRPAAEPHDGNFVIGSLLGGLLAALLWGGLVAGLRLIAG